MIAPYSDKKIELILKGKTASKPYIDITTNIMKVFGARIKNNNYRTFVINNQEKYKPKKYYIEGDASNASYFMAAAAVTKSKIKINGLNTNSHQGDIKFISVLKQLGCKIHSGKNYIEVTGNEIKSISIDMNEMPDLVQTLSVILLFSKGKSSIKNVYNLRFKECDRLFALSTELRKLGMNVKEMKSGIQIEPKRIIPAYIDTYNDHRMAMSFSVAGLKIKGVTIKNTSCVNKSFPNYWKIFNNTFYK